MRFGTSGLLDVETWLRFAKSVVFSSSYTGSWYLLASIFGVFTVSYACRRIDTFKVLLLALPIQALCIASTVYRNLIPSFILEALDVFCFPLNAFGGIFYITIGKLIAEKRRKRFQMKASQCAALAVMFLLAHVIELAYATHRGWLCATDCGIFIIPTALFLALFALKSNFLSTLETKNLRKASTIIYCGQGNILLAIGAFFKITHLTKTVWGRMVLGAVMMSILVAVCIRTQNSKRYSLFKYLT